MKRSRTRLSYADRVLRVVQHLVRHPEQDPSLEQLAAIGLFSPFHFHRIYHAMTGETVKDTQRRLRLHQAAISLLGSTDPIKTIAQRAGYGSQAAFTRAFANAYGQAPARYRQRGQAPSLLPRFTPPEAMDMYEVRIENRPEITVIARTHHGAYHQIGQVFEHLQVWAAARQLLRDSTRWFGMYPDDPSAKPEAELRSTAAFMTESVTRPGETPLDDSVHWQVIAGGRYAVIEHVGPYAELDRAYHWLFCSWLPQSGEEGRDGPCVEEYLNDVRTVPPHQLRTQIAVPLC
ncbi:AraC family transcriptional regulator [Tahibacter amnicola]|uniref:AraC family transcriptional regulator n=1 Tax=Tahibacter amnicola TaxID=2976241 RepID=A0ABY6BNV3_9GAMM|nr:AraC family transcriptional regulator [Tahibacter amnicola]UXI70075.1 AraC family transcriptional regulator [Tahibacter amnicola]